ncbi:DUF1540 domain-containing protein [Brachybacterium sp. NBEC-018]|uniref:DUF1540 domain-containing protein n=1 Tax=Brachybacterium sp. NBEC-018 TaxID=2996004 RepID=UPI0021755AFE|nr:DUF1540 domain-containing protein [Brachybacterium sp. NBEC-018]UVY84261.1 DUF1540 domain-containing protein [Brachybacterium sp. NBEC-018]
MTAVDMPRVSECTVSGCSYNHEHACGAFAVTVSRDTSCATFIPLDVKGGLSKVVTQVGACQKADCIHNQDLECTAESVRVGAGADAADCLSYEKR